MLNASTMSYIAQNMSVERNGTNLQFTFEHRIANVPIDPRFSLEKSLNDAAITAAKQLFAQDCLGAILTTRMLGEDTFDDTKLSAAKRKPKRT